MRRLAVIVFASLVLGSGLAVGSSGVALAACGGGVFDRWVHSVGRQADVIVLAQVASVPVPEQDVALDVVRVYRGDVGSTMVVSEWDLNRSCVHRDAWVGDRVLVTIDKDGETAPATIVWRRDRAGNWGWDFSHYRSLARLVEALGVLPSTAMGDAPPAPSAEGTDALFGGLAAWLALAALLYAAGWSVDGRRRATGTVGAEADDRQVR